MVNRQQAVVFLIFEVAVIYFSLYFFGNYQILNDNVQNKQNYNHPLYGDNANRLNFDRSSFSGKVFRQSKQIKHFNESILGFVDRQKQISCERWAVVTTIYKASDSVRVVLQDPDWCLLIVADRKTPSEQEYLTDLGATDKDKSLLFLSPENQTKLFPLLSKVIPWNHIGRKNIGYMYAIKHGAKQIWDFDDDNKNLLPTNIIKTVMKYRTPCEDSSHMSFNPYPYFSVNETYTWPRGLPLQHIRENLTVPKLCTSTKKKTIGVIQSLANIEPDVDAIYRFTRQTPFNFGATPSSHLSVMVPLTSYTPFNSQASLWMKEAFLFLPLPISVNMRVTDIWRSYIAQYFFRQRSLHVAFVPPYIDQYRNAHDILTDFNDELDIYQKCEQLLNWLSDSVKSFDSLSEIYQEMFRRGYLEEVDIAFIDAWVKTYASEFKN